MEGELTMKRRGFGLLELILAIFLLAIGIATAAYMIPLATRGITQSRQSMQAAYFAQMRMEEALVRNSADLVSASPDAPELTGEIRRQSYNLGLTRVTVVVYRTDDPNRRPVIELETLGM